MRVLAIVHQRDAGPGVFAEAIGDAGGALDEWTLAERPQPPGDPFGYDAVMVLGGAMNVDEGDRHGWIAEEEALLRELLAREVPLMGLCLGGQLLATAAGAQPRRASRPEIGWNRVEVTPEGEDDALLGPSPRPSKRSSGTATSSRYRPAPSLSPAARFASRPAASARTPTRSSSTPR